MKYKLLKDQNNSFRKTIEQQNQTIVNQKQQIDNLTKIRLELLSRLEIMEIKLLEQS